MFYRLMVSSDTHPFIYHLSLIQQQQAEEDNYSQFSTTYKTPPSPSLPASSSSTQLLARFEETENIHLSQEGEGTVALEGGSRRRRSSLSQYLFGSPGGVMVGR